MKKYKCFWLLLCVVLFSCTKTRIPQSPDGKLLLEYADNKGDSPSFRVIYSDNGNRIVALEIPSIGVVSENGRGKDLKYIQVEQSEQLHGEYTMIMRK